MGGSVKEQLDLLEQKIKFTLRPLINSINTSGMNRERRVQLDNLLLEISTLHQNVESHVEQERSTESRIRLTGLVDYLYSLIKGAGIQVNLPERREHSRNELPPEELISDETSESKDIKILNISMGGMRMHSPTNLKVGSVFRTKLNSSRHGVIPLRGEVVWSRPKQNGGGYIIGVHFSQMNEAVLEALESFLNERDE
jgi:hypothetical protein